MSPALRAYQCNLLAYKRTWRGSLTTTFLYPVLYLVAIGVGLGHLIDHGARRAFGGVPYLWLLALGLLAGKAMHIGTNESSFAVKTRITGLKTHLAVLATPLEVTDIV
jgi:lipooligosaccharide transport system permease protein